MNLIDYAYLAKNAYNFTGEGLDKFNLDTYKPYSYTGGLHFYTIQATEIEIKTLYVVIQGTRNLEDLIQDIQPFIPFELPDLLPAGKIQRGWLNLALKVKEMLGELTNPCFIGHSLGGAVALILLLLCGGTAIGFGVPQFCDQTIVNYFEANLMYWVVNSGDDPVADVTLYPAESAELSEDVVWLTKRTASINLFHHSLDDYISRLKLFYKNVKIIGCIVLWPF